MLEYLQRSQSPCAIVEFPLSTDLSSTFHDSPFLPCQSPREFLYSTKPANDQHDAYPITNIEVCLERKTVCFSTVEIREYDICVGNCPHGGTTGLPLSLDWTYNPIVKTVDLSDTPFEHESERRLAHHLTFIQRMTWLMSFYSSLEDVWLAERERKREERRLDQDCTEKSLFDLTLDDDRDPASQDDRQVKPLYDEQRIGKSVELLDSFDLAARSS